MAFKDMLLVNLFLCSVAVSGWRDTGACRSYVCSTWQCKFPFNLNCSSAVSAAEDLGTAPPGNYNQIELEDTPVTKLYKNSFQDARAVEYLVRGNLGLVDIQEGSLGTDNLQLIEAMNFNKNNISYFPFSSLGTFPSVRVIDLSHNALAEISNDVQWPEMLQELYLSWNQLDSFPFETTKNLKSLKTLQLLGNRFSHLPVMEWPSKLERLNLNINSLKQFPFESLSGHSSLLFLNLAENQLKSIPENIQWPATLTDLYLTSNKITTIKLGTFTSAIKLKQLSLASNLLSEIPSNIQWPSSLEELLLHVNQLKSFPFHTIQDLHNLRHLALDNNQLSIIPTNVVWPSSLEALTFSGNQLKYIAPATFAAATGLKHLWLSYNRLTLLEAGGLYTSSTHQPELWLNNNQIAEVEENAFGEQTGGLPYEEIGLSHNQLPTVGKKGFRTLLMKNFPQNQTVTLYFSGNPILCDCKLKWLYTDGDFYGESFKSQVPDLVCNNGWDQDYFFWDLPPSYFEICS